MFNLLSATTFEIKRLNALKNTEAEIYLLRTRNVKEKNNQGVKIFKFKKKGKDNRMPILLACSPPVCSYINLWILSETKVGPRCDP